MQLGHWISLHGLVVVLAVAVFLSTTHSLRQRRHPSAAIAWLLSLTLIPYLALPLYLLLGNRKFARPSHQQARRVTALDANLDPTQTLACQLGLPAPCGYSHFALHDNGAQSYQSLLALIDGARRSIDVSTFVLGRDALGRALCAKLAARAQDGLRVRLVVDGVGRYLGGFPNLHRLRRQGVDVAVFIPPLFSALPGRTNLRNHRKLLIADGERLWIGGRNLAQEYFDQASPAMSGAPAWKDLSFELHGAIARQAQLQFEQDWALATSRTPRSPVVAASEGADSSERFVQLIPSGPDQAEDTVYALLMAACYSAKLRIVAVTPYFVPDPALLMALTLAVRRGVTVDLLLPRQSNHRLADLARMVGLRELYAAGARIWMLADMIHAKAIVFDDALALSGSANLDERSLFLNFELMVAFYQPDDVRQFARWIDAQISKAAAFNATTPGPVREMAEGVVRWLAFQL